MIATGSVPHSCVHFMTKVNDAPFRLTFNTKGNKYRSNDIRRVVCNGQSHCEASSQEQSNLGDELGAVTIGKLDERPTSKDTGM